MDRLRPGRVVVVEPGEWRVRQELLAAVPGLEILPDRHFLCSAAEFSQWAKGRRQLRMEFFYREMRRKTGLLMEGGHPAGGAFNFDASNRASFGARGPGPVRPPLAFPPDATTRAVLDLVARRFAAHPGSLDRFDWPVTRAEALLALDDFLAHGLPSFGRFQDAMWAGEPFLFHSRLSAAMNLKLLDPREVLRGAEAAWRSGASPIESVEGFVRQVLGWREYVRGIYWLRMPEYLEENALGADRPLPSFFWSGETEMACLADVLRQTLDLGYAHHIQRLMVTGLFALLLGVRPVEVHRWYLAVYVDAVEWVELPERPRHVAARRRRLHGVEAVRRDGEVHPADGQPLPLLPLRPRAGDRRESLPVHDPLLGLPRAPSGVPGEERPHAPAAEEPRPPPRGDPARDPAPRRHAARGGGLRTSAQPCAAEPTSCPAAASPARTLRSRPVFPVGGTDSTPPNASPARTSGAPSRLTSGSSPG